MATRTLAVLQDHRPRNRELRLSAIRYCGRNRFDLRVWYADTRIPGAWRASREGIIVDESMLPTFLERLRLTAERLPAAWREMELLDEGGEKRERVSARCRLGIVGA